MEGESAVPGLRPGLPVCHGVCVSAGVLYFEVIYISMYTSITNERAMGSIAAVTVIATLLTRFLQQ